MISLQQIDVTEEDLKAFESMQFSWHEEAHRISAVEIAKSKMVFDSADNQWCVTDSNVRFAVRDDYAKLELWKQKLDQQAVGISNPEPEADNSEVVVIDANNS